MRPFLSQRRPRKTPRFSRADRPELGLMSGFPLESWPRLVDGPEISTRIGKYSVKYPRERLRPSKLNDIMMRLRYLVSVFALCVLYDGSSRVLYAALVVDYASSASAGSLGASGTGTSVSGLSLSRGTGLTATGGSTYGATEWTSAGTADANDYFQWGFTSTQPYDLTNLEIAFRSSKASGANNGGPNSADFQISVNGGSFVSFATLTGFQDSTQVSTISLSSFTNVSSATFRLYGLSAENSSGVLDIVNSLSGNTRGIVVNGTLSAIPEPAAFLLGGLICGIVGVAFGGKTYLSQLLRRAKA
jgi:hypothetical protein